MTVVQRLTTIAAVVIVAGAGLLQWRQFGGHIDLPSGDSESMVIHIDEQGQVVESTDMETNDKAIHSSVVTEKEIMVADGVKHSVPLDEIKGGGPPQDGIPSIDDPKFAPIREIDFLNEQEPGLAVSLGGVDRFYPFQILVWHEIVNDVFPLGPGGTPQRVLVTYCPLCISGIVFDPVVQGERVEFGTSGKLWQSNLVMYDRKTNSLWSQILGESILGEMTGSQLQVLPSDQIRYGDWKALHPDGQVLTRDTGATRFYGQDPDEDYYTDNSAVFFPVSERDDRLENKDFVLGVVVDGKAKAYYPPAVKAQGEVVDQFAGKTIVARYDSEIDAVRLFERLPSGREERINPFPNFWFSWVAAHPETELYK